MDQPEFSESPKPPRVSRVHKPLYIDIYKAAITGLTSNPTYENTPDNAIILLAHSLAARSVQFIESAIK